APFTTSIRAAGRSRPVRSCVSSQGRCDCTNCLIKKLVWQERDSLCRFVWAETIADAAHSLDALAGVAQFAAKRFDVHVDGSFQNDGVADRGVHEIMSCEGPARLLHQGFQETELRRRQ